MSKIPTAFLKKTFIWRQGLAVVFLVLCLQASIPFLASVMAATPAISSITVSSVQTNAATIGWTTDVASDTQVEYGLTASYGSSTTLNGSLVTNHSQVVGGLQANQLYHYRVKSKDVSGDLAASGDRTFITNAGSSSSGTATDSGNSNTMNTTRFTTGSGGKLGSVSAYVGAVDATVAKRNYQMAIYTANGTTPGTLVASTATGTLTANSWNTLPINGTLAPNTNYFLAYNSNGSSDSVNNLRYTNGGISGWSTAGQTFGTWPTTFGQTTAQDVTFSMYASFVSDTVPPTVAITAPTEGSVVSGGAQFTANATDESGVSSVQFKLNGNNLGVADTTAPYAVSWDSTLSLNSSYTLTAIATDTNGNNTTSAPVAFTTNNEPRIVVTSPTVNQTIEATSITVTYTKNGDWLPGDGKHAHFRLDGGTTKMDFDTDGNQSYTFLDVPAGQHTIEAAVANGSHVEFAGSGMSVAFSSIAPDVTPPTVSLTAPANNATVANAVTVSAAAADETSLKGVQFFLDGNVLGAEDTTAPYTMSWDTLTTTNGTHSLTARARDSLNQTTSAPVTVNVQNNDQRAVVGEWSPVMNWPLVAVHSTLMYTGEVLMWDAWETPTTQAKLWNPTTNIFTDVPLSAANAGLFCSGHATDADGNLIVMGGHEPDSSGIKNVYSFNPTTKAWTRKADMQYPRWYPSVTQMPDNRMITFSGQSVQGTFVNTPEIFNAKTNTMSTVPISTPQLREIQYPQTSVLPSGKILAISTEQGGVMTYNPSNNAWTNTGTTQVPFGVWTSFAPGKYLITGGGEDFNSYDVGNPGTSQKKSRILDMTNDTPVWSDAGTMNQGRSFHNVTMLPTGKALAIGGAPQVTDFAEVGTVTAEQWDPATKTWTAMANPAKPRMYHSTSLLLPDGRVLSAGGGRLKNIPPDQLNAQIYSPSYMFQGARPTITSGPSAISHNSTMDFVSPEAADIAKVSFVSLGSVTHTADWNQHFMELPFTRNGDTLSINTPANTNLAPDNYYMVFLVNSAGVPSQAKIVKLSTPDTGAPTVTNVQATSVTGTAATISWTTNEDSDSQVEYGPTTSYGSSTTLDATLSTSHSQNLTGLTSGTQYHYRVKSKDASGNLTTSGDYTFTTTASDGVAPTVSLTSPTGGTVNGTVNFAATASDNVGVVGVQFKVDGVNAGTEDTSSPYGVSWNSASVANGSHTITAVARDAAGNTTTSSGVVVNVSNSVSGGLVASYSFNEGTGTTVADGSGTGNSGSIFQAAWYAAGKFGKALSFDGSNDYVSVNDSASLDLTNKMTLEAWVRPTASSGWRTVMLKENGSEMSYGMYARESSNRPSAWMRLNPTSGSSQSAGATPGLTLNTWSHMAATYDGTSLKLYINGALRATTNQSGSMYVGTGPLKFGGNAVWGEYFAGQLDEIRIYNRALTPTEVQTDMNTAL
ncbi:MAG TPA: Ig-like domain-containing protein [Candidatus Saccharimonadales bacterium]